MDKKPFNNNPKAKINESYRPTDEEQHIREQVYKRHHEMKQGREKYDVHWDKWEQQWEGWREEKSNDDWTSNIVAQLSTSIVETLMAEIQQYDIEPPIKARGYEDVARAELMKEAVKFSKQQGNFKLEAEDVKKDAFVFGNGFGEELLWQDKRKISFAKLRVTSGGKKEVFMEEQDVYHYNGLYFEHVPIRDLWFDEAAKTINEGRRQANDAIRQFIMPYEGAMDWFAELPGAIRDNLKYVRPGGDLSHYQFYEPPNRIDKETEVQVLFYTAKRPDALWIVANDIVVASGPNIYNHKQLPYAGAYDIKRTNSLYHKGEMELLESLQEELTKIKRMRLDRLHLTIDPMWLTSRRDNISEEDLMSRPHGAIEVDDPTTAARELRPSDTQASAYKEEESLLMEAQRATGVDDGSQAIQRTSLTATEFAGLRESTLRKVALKLWHIHNGFHVSHTRLRVANILQYWTQPKWEKVVGEEKSEYYRTMLQEKQRMGLMKEENGQQMMANFPRIRTQDKKIFRTDSGEIKMSEEKGTHFFEVTPKDIIPFYQGFDIVYDGTPEIPLTKTLMQTKAGELVDRIMPVALSGIGGYDPGKMMDWYIRKFDSDPDAFKKEEEQQKAKTSLLDIAMVENQQMIKGSMVPPTPNSIPAHTQIHTAFMKSQDFQRLDANDPQDRQIIDAFAQHVQGELMAQQQRQQPGVNQPPEIKGTDGQVQAPANQDNLQPPGAKTGSSPIGGFIRRALGR